ncbi:MAG: hypothetical protein Kow00127_01890 [Bacteroidales bacterium]
MLTDMPRLVIITGILWLTVINGAFTQDSIPPDYCLSDEEYKLYSLINDYRKAMNLPELPLSKSLSYVARTHAVDLVTNRPDTNTCNFHSWSDKGSWTPCCFEKSLKDRSCMQNKPEELTGYPGPAFEIVYWENRSATADRAFEQWRETAPSRALITNFKEWEEIHWKALGTGIYKNFAIVWFGEYPDPEKETVLCNGEVIANKLAEEAPEPRIVDHPTGRFYLIFGSFASEADAREQLDKYLNEGFSKAKIIVRDGKYRISLSDYPDTHQASAAKKELPSKYREAWILPY